MKSKTNTRTKTLLFVFLLTATITASAQVTIGTGTAPVSGALLQLKETDATKANSIRGMGMPRVVLTNLKKLQPMYSYADEANKPSLNELQSHIGLIVYHVSENLKKECAAIPDGLYVWDGEQWNSILDKKPGGLSLSTNTLTFFNADPQSLDVSWSPNGGSVAPPTYTPPSDFSFSPASGTWTAGLASPQTVSITPTAFPTEPFAAKEDVTATFTFAACDNQTLQLTLKQVNKALTINNSQKPAMVLVTTDGTKKASLKSNAKWQLTSITPSGTTSALSAITVTEGGTSTTLTGGTKVDWESDAATGTANNLSYTVKTGQNLARYNILKFSDTNDPVRFTDVMLTVAQCTGESDLSMEEYCKLWEELYGDPTNPLPDSDGDPIKNKNKVQWHRDQEGNIFFSALFGSAGRWMTTNLATTIFDPIRTSGDAISQNFNANDSYPSPRAGNNTYLYPVYGYPKMTNDSTAAYTKRKRLGLLYNWAAASNSKGGTTDGKGNVDNPAEGNPANNESQYAEWDGTGMQPANTQKRRQGICPNGWHLPSDLEWTKLENELQISTSKYSSQNNIGGIPPTTPPSSYPNIGKPFQDMCEGSASFGTSNSVLDGGFNGLLAGGSAYNYGSIGYFWSSSSCDSNGTWNRYVSSGNAQVNRSSGYGRVNLFSVRCKKDN